jgi:hypothetical protein
MLWLDEEISTPISGATMNDIKRVERRLKLHERSIKGFCLAATALGAIAAAGGCILAGVVNGMS